MSMSQEPGSLALAFFDAKTNAELTPDLVLYNSSREKFYKTDALAPGLYNLRVEQKGYFTKTQTVNVISQTKKIYNISLQPKPLSQDELAVTLTWDDQIKNIDLNVLFKVNSTDSCHVYFNHKQCGGARLEGFTVTGGHTGGESIRLTLGPSHYLFYVKARGGGDDPFPLTLSNARINVYSIYSDTQLLQLEVPEAYRMKNVWLAF